MLLIRKLEHTPGPGQCSHTRFRSLAIFIPKIIYSITGKIFAIGCHILHKLGLEYIFETITEITYCKVMTFTSTVSTGTSFTHMPKTHPPIKDRDWWRPGHVTFVSFPSSFPLTTRSALLASGLPPTGNGESWRPSYCVSAVCQNKAKWRSKQKSKTILFTI